jgi:hypothetical protein
MASMKFHYPNIDRIEDISAPLLFVHSSMDIKINATHSRELFLKATHSAGLENEGSGHQYGHNVKNVTFASSARWHGVPGSTGAVQCAYPVERHVLAGAGHLEAYAHRSWLALVPAFIRKAEQFAADSGGTC